MGSITKEEGIQHREEDEEEEEEKEERTRKEKEHQEDPMKRRMRRKMRPYRFPRTLVAATTKPFRYAASDKLLSFGG